MSDYAPTAPSPPPKIQPVSSGDVSESLRCGWQDFKKAPLISLFFGGVYVLGGILIFWLLNAFQKPWMIVPVAIGFPLVGPFLAAGTYEVSRRLEADEPVGFGVVLGFMAHQSRREFSWMAFVVLFIFWIWMYQARILIALFLDMQAFSSVGALGTSLFTTADGLTMLGIGTISGGILAAVLFTTTVISMPLLVERELDVVTAIVTSWKTVLQNPFTMLLWGAAIAALTIVALIPMFMGLFIVFPVLGYATWHLYRRAVVRPDMAETGGEAKS